jgi:hypothetical protein
MHTQEKENKERQITIKFGLSICTFLTALFAISKVLNYGECAKWSWWWVISPYWIPIALIAAILLGLGIIIGGGATLIDLIINLRRRRRAKKLKKISWLSRKKIGSNRL